VRKLDDALAALADHGFTTRVVAGQTHAAAAEVAATLPGRPSR
jgi:hypothetical protein